MFFGGFFCFVFFLFCFVFLINWNTKLKIKFWLLFFFWSWDIKHKTKWFFNFQNNWTLKVKFESRFLKSTFTIKKLDFEMTLGEHFTMAASAIIFNIVIEFKSKFNMRVTASNINIKCISCFLNSGLLVSAWSLHSRKFQGTRHELPLE